MDERKKEARDGWLAASLLGGGSDEDSRGADAQRSKQTRLGCVVGYHHTRCKRCKMLPIPSRPQAIPNRAKSRKQLGKYISGCLSSKQLDAA